MIPSHFTITHLGAETCVTGSCHLVRFQPDQGGGSVAILVDCGIAQGHDPQVPFGRFPVPPADIDFLFLTHAHIDHIGRVPDRINPGVPVFIDSPLGIHITRLYQDMDDCWDREAKALKAAGDHPIRFNHLYAVEKFQDHQRLLQLTGPAVIIAGSGMCTGGRILNHLKHGLDDPKNDLFFVGFQAKGTPGLEIVEGRTSQQ